jgi:hypothetical protein
VKAEDPPKADDPPKLVKKTQTPRTHPIAPATAGSAAVPVAVDAKTQEPPPEPAKVVPPCDEKAVLKQAHARPGDLPPCK